MAYTILFKTSNYFLLKVTYSSSLILLVKHWYTMFSLTKKICSSNKLWQSSEGKMKVTISVIDRTVPDGLDIHSVIAFLTLSQRINYLSDKWEMDYFLCLHFTFSRSGRILNKRNLDFQSGVPECFIVIQP